MGQIENSVIVGLTQPMVQARIDSFDARSFLFGRYFPIVKVNGFSWETLTSQMSGKNVAADIHADNATILRKRRPVFESASGDIPYISISREKFRKEIKAYQTALKFANTQDASALVQHWGGDIDFCFNGVQSELDFIAWSLASNAGVLHFTTSNNATFANEFDLDYQVADELKVATTSDWSKPATADVLGDLQKLVKTAKGYGLNPKFIFMNMDEWYKVASSEQVIKACASFASNAIGVSMTPSLEQVNQMLAGRAWLNGIQIRVIDQTITRELINGEQTSRNPFLDNRIILTESERLGNTQYDILEENIPSSILKAVRGHTVVKKYSVIEPYSEVTIAHTDGIPVFDTAYRNLYVRTDATEWEF